MIQKKESSDSIFKSFLLSAPLETRDKLTALLSETEKERLALIQGREITKASNPCLNLDHIHWSWLLPSLKTYSPKEQKIFVSALPHGMQTNLMNELGFTPPLPPIQKIAADFLKEALLNHLVGHQSRLLPIDYIPFSPFNQLLTFSKTQFLILIDSLSLYDLAFEIKHILNTKILKKIYAFLSLPQKRFLKLIAQNKDLYPLSRLGISQWNGQEASLSILLHKKGLARLGAGLHGQDENLTWHVCHLLDVGRGNALFKCIAKQVPKEISHGILLQIEDILKNKELFE